MNAGEVWRCKIKNAFVLLLDKAGFRLGPVMMGDNERLYGLWQELQEPEGTCRGKGLRGLADEISMTYRPNRACPPGFPDRSLETGKYVTQQVQTRHLRWLNTSLTMAKRVTSKFGVRQGGR